MHQRAKTPAKHRLQRKQPLYGGLPSATPTSPPQVKEKPARVSLKDAIRGVKPNQEPETVSFDDRYVINQ